MSEEQPVVFVVDDDPSVREALAGLLRSVGLEVQSFGSTQGFLQSKRPDAPGCLVLDVRLPGRSGLDFQRSWPSPAFICRSCSSPATATSRCPCAR